MVYVRKSLSVIVVLSLLLPAAKGYNIASNHGYLIEVGAHHVSEEWSTGIDYDSTGTYLLLGHGLLERLMVYWSIFADNPVINQGVSNPNDETDRTDVSPNTYIFGFGLGVRGILWTSEKWDVMGTLDYHSMSEFDDFVEWSNGVYSDIHIDEISTMAASLIAIRNLGAMDAFLGCNVSSTYAHGEVITMIAGDQDTFTEFDERDKVAVKSVFGFNYEVSEHWDIFLHGEAGEGYAGKVGFNRAF